MIRQPDLNAPALEHDQAQRVYTATYADGTTAAGPTPLPSLSPDGAPLTSSPWWQQRLRALEDSPMSSDSHA